MWLINKNDFSPYLELRTQMGRITAYKFRTIKTCVVQRRYCGELKYYVLYETRLFGWRDLRLRFRQYGSDVHGSDIHLYYDKEACYAEYSLWGLCRNIQTCDLRKLICCVTSGDTYTIRDAISACDVLLSDLFVKLNEMQI